jgi:hypothetical protein
VSARSSIIGPRIGIALSATCLWAVAARQGRFGRGSGDVRVRELEPLGTESDWPDLAAALAELRDELGGDGGTVSVALLPPLVQLRGIELPPVTDEEAQRVLARNAGRYFIGVREPQAVAVVRARRRFRRAGSVMAAAASARLVNAVLAAARSAGWRVSVVAPAHAAWVTAARSQWSRLGKEPARIAVLREDGSELIQIDGGAITAVRHFGPGSNSIEELVSAAAEQGEAGRNLRVVAVGGSERRSQLGQALRGHAITLEADGRSIPLSEAPEALAAAESGSVKEFDLLPQHAHSEREATARRTTLGLAAAAALLLAVAIGAQMWGLKREIAAVQAERDRIRASVRQVVDARTVIGSLTSRLAALQPFETDAPRWSVVIGSMATSLPRDAHLISLTASDDSVMVDGVAKRAPGVFPALQRAAGITSVQPAAAIRRDVDESGAPIERFSLVARVAPRDSTPAAARSPR